MGTYRRATSIQVWKEGTAYNWGQARVNARAGQKTRSSLEVECRVGHNQRWTEFGPIGATRLGQGYEEGCRWVSGRRGQDTRRER